MKRTARSAMPRRMSRRRARKLGSYVATCSSTAIIRALAR